MVKKFVEATREIIRGLDVLEFDRQHMGPADLGYEDNLRGESERIATLFSLLPEGKPLDVCEIGMGYGHIAIPLLKLFPDVSLSTVEAPGRGYVDSRTYRKLLEDYHIQLRLADITTTKLPFGDESFDVILFADVMDHLSPVPIPWILKDIRRCLRTDGTLIVTTRNLLRLRNRIRLFVGKALFDSPVGQIGGTNAGTIRQYSHDEVIALLDACGFHKIENIRNDIVYQMSKTVTDRAVSKVSSLLVKLSVKFGDCVIVKATK